MIFGDNPSGEIFYVDADNLPKGGQDGHPPHPAQRQGHAEDAAAAHPREERGSRARTPRRAPTCGSASGPQGQIFVLNKRDGVIRLLVP